MTFTVTVAARTREQKGVAVKPRTRTFVQAATARESRCAPTLRLTRCSALSTVLRVALQTLAHLLVGVAVQVQPQHAALEL